MQREETPVKSAGSSQKKFHISPEVAGSGMGKVASPLKRNNLAKESGVVSLQIVEALPDQPPSRVVTEQSPERSPVIVSSRRQDRLLTTVDE